MKNCVVKISQSEADCISVYVGIYATFLVE